MAGISSWWFHHLLQGSADNFIWAVEQIPAERLYRSSKPERWAVAHIIFHMVDYEQRLALPSLQQWIGGARPVALSMEEDAALEEQRWNDGEGHAVPEMIAAFREVRLQQLAVLTQLDEAAWQETREVIWGERPLQWVVTKTYQHTLEHTDEVLRNYLWGK